MAINEWLDRPNQTVSQLLGCTVSHLTLIRSQLSGCLAALAIILAADGTGLYGWAALCATEAVHHAMPLIRNFNRKGGKK